MRNEIGNIMSEVAAHETAASVEPRHHAETRLDARGRGDAARRRPRGELTVVHRASAPWPPDRAGGLLWPIAAAVLLVLLVADCLLASRAAGVVVRVVFGRATGVTAAGPHRPVAEEEPSIRDVRSTLSATTGRTRPLRSLYAARNIVAGRPFGFGMPDA